MQLSTEDKELLEKVFRISVKIVEDTPVDKFPVDKFPTKESGNKSGIVVTLRDTPTPPGFPEDKCVGIVLSLQLVQVDKIQDQQDRQNKGEKP